MNTSGLPVVDQLPRLRRHSLCSPPRDLESCNLCPVSLHLSGFTPSPPCLQQSHPQDGSDCLGFLLIGFQPFLSPAACMILLETLITPSKRGTLPSAREGRTSHPTKLQKASGLASLLLLSELCLSHLSSVLLLWPPSQLAFPTCFDDTCALRWETSPKLPQTSDNQLPLGILAHVPLSFGKSFGLCRECNQQPFPIPSSCFPDYSCLSVTSLLFNIQGWWSNEPTRLVAKYAQT